MRVTTKVITSAIATVVFVSLQCALPAAQGDERFANLLELAQPRPEHALLEDLVGDFEFETHFTVPYEAASDWTGTTQNRWAIGGRFLRCEALSRRGGLEIESLRIIGFDPGPRRFHASTFESLSLGRVDASGSFDADKRTIVFEVETKDPASGSRSRTTEVLRVLDRDRYTREIWGRGSAGEPLQLARTEYTRKR